MRRSYPLFLLPALGILLLDQVTKQVVSTTLPIHSGYPIIKGFFDLTHVRNRGMAFGLLNRPGSDLHSYLLIATTLAAVFLLIVWFTRLTQQDRQTIFGLSLIVGGAVGNLIDRIRLGEVIDFLDFHLGALHWPAFNVADSAITVGTCWLAIHMLFASSPKRRGHEESRGKGHHVS